MRFCPIVFVNNSERSFKVVSEKFKGMVCFVHFSAGAVPVHLWHIFVDNPLCTALKESICICGIGNAYILLFSNCPVLQS